MPYVALRVTSSLRSILSLAIQRFHVTPRQPFVLKNKETTAILVYKGIPPENELFSSKHRQYGFLPCKKKRSTTLDPRALEKTFR